MSMKNPLTPAGIEPATSRFVAQHLNHCAETYGGKFYIAILWENVRERDFLEDLVINGRVILK